MDIISKKLLNTIVYYTLVVLAIASAGFFVFALMVKDIPLWAKVIYYIWVGLLVGAVIFDIVCTVMRGGKNLSGLIIYILSIMAVGMVIVLYCINATKTGLPVDFFNLYLSISIISLMTTGYTIATWCVGDKMVKNANDNQATIEE